MRNLEFDILNKFEIIELKQSVISILHSLQFDDCYYIEDCIIGLHNLLSKLDEIEISQKTIMMIHKSKLSKKVLKNSKSM